MQNFAQSIRAHFVFTILWKNTLIGVVLFIPISTSAQIETHPLVNSTLNGIVVDSITREPLQGAVVQLDGVTHSLSTDSEGKFNFVTGQKLPATLLISYIGYKNTKIIVNESPIEISLSPDLQQLDDIVVVGYGTQVQRKITGSISTLTAAQLEDQPVGQFAQKLQGKIPGVQINQASGQPGGGMAIRIRGAASINAGNSPLYVIDGFPIVGDINNINPNEIESFSVLKGSAATSLYGSRAANGVLLITTKRAKQGQTNVQFSINNGFAVVPQKGRAKLMNAKEFLQFEKEIYEDKARYEGYTDGIPELYQNPETWDGPDTDWYDVILQTGQVNNYNLTISSEKEKFSTATTAGYYREKGTVLNTGYNRFSLRSNNEYNISNAVRIGVNLAPSYQTSQNFNTDGNGAMIYQVLSTPPIFSPDETNADGTRALSFSGPGLFAQPNWYRVFTESENRLTSSRLLSNAYIEADLTEGLHLKSAASIDLLSSNRKQWSPSSVGSSNSIPPSRASASYVTQSYYSWLTENTVNYTRTFAQVHNFDALLGYSAQRYRQEDNVLTGTDFPDDLVSWIDAAATKGGSSNSSEWSLLSLFSRINYDYKGKYLLSGTLRRDGSSRFGPDNRWGTFPSFSAGWVLSEENFANDWHAINFLKLRGEFGYTGNFNIGDYNQYGNVFSVNYVFGEQLSQGRSPVSIGNSNLTWETTKGLDIGLDVGMLKDRLSFTFDYYNKTTYDMLYQIDIPYGSGFSNIQSNIGEFNFWGYEFSASSKNITGRFKWNTDFNISFNRNKAVKLGTNNTPIGGIGEQGESSYWKTEVGKPLGLFYGYVFEGVYMTQEDFDQSAKQATSAVGTAKMKDINEDGVINSLDKDYIGNPNPDFVFGLTNSFTYRNIDLNIIISGAYGGDIFAFRGWNNILEGILNVQKDLKDRWRSLEQPGWGYQARTLSGTAAFGRYTSSKWVHDGSYLSVKNITLGYTFPKRISHFRNARVFASVQQPFIFSTYPYGNPEASYKGLNGLQLGYDATAYPVPKTYTIGLDFNF